jgi:hypothetical protein
MKAVSRAKDPVQEPGRGKQSVSAFLTKILPDLENTGGVYVATPHRQHHFVFESLMQKLHRHSEPGRGFAHPLATIDTTALLLGPREISTRADPVGNLKLLDRSGAGDSMHAPGRTTEILHRTALWEI